MKHESMKSPAVMHASCPTCGQPARQPCLTLKTRVVAEPHKARVRSYDATAKPQPEVAE